MDSTNDYRVPTTIPDMLMQTISSPLDADKVRRCATSGSEISWSSSSEPPTVVTPVALSKGPLYFQLNIPQAPSQQVHLSFYQPNESLEAISDTLFWISKTAESHAAILSWLRTGEDLEKSSIAMPASFDDNVAGC